MAGAVRAASGSVSGTTAGEEKDPGSMPLPRLREDLEIMEGAPHFSGAPGWMLFDPLRNAYFRINHTVFQLLSLWDEPNLGQLKARAVRQLGRAPTDDEVSVVIKFLFANQLTKEMPTEGVGAFAEREKKARKSALSQAMHGYLFFKVPLFRPERILHASWWLVRPLFARTTVMVWAVLALVSIYLVSRQWDAFVGQFLEFLSLKGLIYFGLSLVFVKVCHEFGHAYMATRFGLRVPIIGVAFLVLMPILYTDTSNAWRLKRRRDRLLIDSAGIMAELLLAVLATLAWVFLPDGALRATAFSIATVSWILSLAVNLNPFMRFDGYYILADALGFENLQARGFAMARWRLREVLFGLGHKRPENLPKPLERFIILHAWGTWIYRFFLFLGIALLVYAFFVKVVAILLFVVEIVWFIALPVWRELKEWWLMRAEIVSKFRARMSFVAAGLLLLAAFLPLSGTVDVQALVRAERETVIYPPRSALLTELTVENGASVKVGQTLATFRAPDLERDRDLTERRIVLLKQRLSRGAADARDRAQRRILLSELQAQRDMLEKHTRALRELVVRAPQVGVIADLAPEIHAGRYIGRNTALFRIRGAGSMLLTGLVPEEDVARIVSDSVGRFVPENPQLASFDVRLKTAASTSIVQLPDADFAQVYGGAIPVRAQNNGTLEPVGSYYAITLAPLQTPPYDAMVLRGTVHLPGEKRSFAGRVFRRVMGVLIRESGF